MKRIVFAILVVTVAANSTLSQSFRATSAPGGSVFDCISAPHPLCISFYPVYYNSGPLEGERVPDGDPAYNLNLILN